MKRLISFLLILILMLSFVSCGDNGEENNENENENENGSENTEGENGSEGDGGTEGETPNDQPPPSDEEDEDAFRVSLTYNGKTVIPDEEITVYWRNEYSLHSAVIGEDGYASVSGLDGDYQVSLSKAPQKYVYNPNVHFATNDEKEITIELYKTTTLRAKPSKNGKTPSTPFEIKKLGVYEAELDTDDVIYYRFEPSQQGEYLIESWVDINGGTVNPKLERYNSNAGGFASFVETIDGGGPESGFTRNFSYTIGVASDEVSENGGNVYVFGVKMTSLADEPYKVVFSVSTISGEYDSNRTTESTLIVPTEIDLIDPYDHYYNMDEYELVEAAVTTVGANGNTYFLLDEENYYYWSVEEGGDGFYHVYDKETGEIGPILYAYITSSCGYIDASFASIEYAGNKNLTVNQGRDNYKHFIEGYNALAHSSPNFNGGSYYCVGECDCHAGESFDMVCLEGCEDCHEDCRFIPEELIDQEGYANVANAQGLCPVTKELKIFLYEFSSSQYLFRDGEGLCEIAGLDSNEASQWLFACAYYVAK